MSGSFIKNTSWNYEHAGLNLKIIHQHQNCFLWPTHFSSLNNIGFVKLYLYKLHLKKHIKKNPKHTKEPAKQTRRRRRKKKKRIMSVRDMNSTAHSLTNVRTNHSQVETGRKAFFQGAKSTAVLISSLSPTIQHVKQSRRLSVQGRPFPCPCISRGEPTHTQSCSPKWTPNRTRNPACRGRMTSWWSNGAPALAKKVFCHSMSASHPTKNCFQK